MSCVNYEGDHVTLSAADYAELMADVNFLRCLEAAGVDNWDGYDFAREAYAEQYGEEE